MACLKSPKVLQTLITKYFKCEVNLNYDKSMNELFNYIEESNDVVVLDLDKAKGLRKSDLTLYISKKRIDNLSERRMMGLQEEIINLRFRLGLLTATEKNIELEKIIF